MNYEWLTPANALWRVTFLIAGSKNLRAWTLVTATHSRLFFREQHSLRPRLLTAMQYPTRPWALFIQKKIWNYHRSTGRKERVLYASIWGRVLCITKHASEIVLEWQTKRRIRFKTVCTRMLKNPESKKKKKKKELLLWVKHKSSFNRTCSVG